MLKICLLLTLLFSTFAHAQMFIPMAFFGPKGSFAMSCASGCYPHPNTNFSASLYYVPTNATVIFRGTSTYPTIDFCFGPNTAGGCQSDAVNAGVYPLNCVGPGAGTMDATGNTDSESDYTAPATVTTDICYATDYSSNKAASASIQTFNPVVVTAPITTEITPINVCVNQTQAITATGGLGTLNWSVVSGTGGVGPLTGGSTTYTAPSSPTLAHVQVRDATTSMTVMTYLNVINTINLTPLTTIEIPINNSTNLHYPATTGVSYTANLNFTANCGLQNYTVNCSGGGTAFPNAGVANNQTVRLTPAATTGTSTLTFTDSSTPTAQTVNRSIYNLVPVDITSNWGYHFCVKYTHSTYAAGTYKIKCWGRNANGQLGYGSTTAKGIAATDLGAGLLFVKDTGTSGTDMMVKEISAGLNHTCAILNNNTVKCWGSNTYGQLGYDNTTQLTSPSATTVNLGAGTPSKIYAFGFKSCVVFTDNRLKCWGRGTRGDLGQNNTISYGSDAAAASMTGLGYISIAGTNVTVQKVVGTENGTCVLTSSTFVPGPSRVYCWGYGNSGNCSFNTMPDDRYCGELGKGTANANWGDGTNLMSALTSVNLGVSGTETLIDISAGRKHVCALIAPNAVSTVGTPICWGNNNRGQLGISNSNDIGETEVPSARISSYSTTATLSLAAEVSCAVFTGGSAKCWGRGNRGFMLGGNNVAGGSYTSNVGDDAAPTMANNAALSLGTGLTIKKIATAYDAACAILNNDYIKCWGAGNCGTGGNTANNGCTMSGYAAHVNSNPIAAPNMMSGRFVGDNANEVGNLLPYVNH